MNILYIITYKLLLIIYHGANSYGTPTDLAALIVTKLNWWVIFSQTSTRFEQKPNTNVCIGTLLDTVQYISISRKLEIIFLVIDINKFIHKLPG